MADIPKQLAKFETENQTRQSSIEEQLLEDDNRTRQKLAQKFVNFYFGILVLIIVGVPLYNYLMIINHQPSLVIALKDAILTYSAVIGSTFGLVVAYYFQSKTDHAKKP